MASPGLMARPWPLLTPGDRSAGVISVVGVWQMCDWFEESSFEFDKVSTLVLLLLFSSSKSDSLSFRLWESDSILSCDWLSESVATFRSASAFSTFLFKRSTSVESSWERAFWVEISWGEITQERFFKKIGKDQIKQMKTMIYWALHWCCPRLVFSLFSILYI